MPLEQNKLTAQMLDIHWKIQAVESMTASEDFCGGLPYLNSTQQG